MSDVIARALADAQRRLSYAERWPELMHDEFGITLDPDEATVLRAIPTNPRVAYSAGRGSGKTFTAACACVCFVCTRVPAKVLLVGPQHDNHIVNGIIPEIHRIILRSPLATEQFAVQTASISARHESLRKSHVILGLAAETPEFLAGHHSPHLLIVCEEAANLPRSAFIALMGSLTSTGGDQRMFMSSTPPATRSGFFWTTAFEDPAGGWVTHITSALDSPRVAREKIEETRRLYGEGSETWASQILGVPLDKHRAGVFVLSHYHSSWRRHPLNPDAPRETVLPYDQFTPAIEKVSRRRRGEPESQPLVVVGCDFSGGGDEAVACFRMGGVHMQFVTLDASTEASQADSVSRAVHEWNRDPTHPPISRIICERSGYGKGAYESLRKEFGGKIVTLWDPSGSPRERTFGNMRAASIVNLSVLMERGEIALLLHDKLEADLAAVQRRETDQGKLFVSKKEDLALTLGRSTDFLDSLAICYSDFAPGKGDSDRVSVVRFSI